MQLPDPNLYRLEWIRPQTALVRNVLDPSESCVVDVHDLEDHGSCTCSDFLYRMQPVIYNPAGLPQGMTWGCKHLRLVWWILRQKRPNSYTSRHTFVRVPLPPEIQSLL
jgi:hypothetical protein